MMISARLRNWLTPDFVIRESFIGAALGLAAIACISVRPVLVKLAYVELRDPITILAMRMAYCLPIASVFLLFSSRQMQAQSAPLTMREKSLLTLMGFFGFYVSSYLDFWSLEFLSAGTSRLITYSYPSFVMVFSILILRRWPTRSEVGALIITYAGLLALLISGTSVAGPEAVQGAGLAWLSAATYALYLVLNSGIGHRVGSLRTASFVILVGSTACVLQFLFTRDIMVLAVSWRVYALTAGMGLITTIIPVYLVTAAMTRIGANRMALIGALGPVLSVGMGVTFLGDGLGVAQVFGASMILAGVAWVTALR
ncbi:DMT family transporter [Bradyrhizobium sp. USDA 336]|uniref:DMT family transporter n=1 Tax=Bradyrhizobium sp. USDA 336 TaxID=3156311 RepID=UPI00383594C4